MSSGDSFHTLHHRFRLGLSTIHGVVLETCKAIWEELAPTEMAAPTTQDWIRIEKEFADFWDFPNCLGALDGKHIVITSPPDTGSLYFNYKQTFSTNLMALVDANYKFIFIDVGQYGSNSDGSVFLKSYFGYMYVNNLLDVPGPKLLPAAADMGPMPHIIVADEAFPLKPNIMRPYPRGKNINRLAHDKHVFNVRLSRSRRIVENSFGILAQRFRIFNRRIQLKVENVDKVVLACCVLHNYLLDNRDVHATNAQLNPDRLDYLGENGAIVELGALRGYRSARESQHIRDKFKLYFSSPAGALDWQDDHIRRGMVF